MRISHTAEETVMTVMRGDVARLGRCTAVTTESEDTIKRSKPFKYAYEKEIVMSVSLDLSTSFYWLGEHVRH